MIGSVYRACTIVKATSSIITLYFSSARRGVSRAPMEQPADQISYKTLYYYYYHSIVLANSNHSIVSKNSIVIVTIVIVIFYYGRWCLQAAGILKLKW